MTHLNAALTPGESPLAPTEVPTRPPRRGFLRRLISNRLTAAAIIVLVLVALGGLLAPWIAPYSPTDTDVFSRFQPPSAEHLLGTDDLGRDVLSRLLYASRLSLTAALIAVGISAAIGAPLGLIAGYVGGRVDSLISRVADAVMSLPTLILALGIIAALGPGLINAMIALGVVYSPRIFRVVRGATMSVRRETYIEAAISVGLPARHVIQHHVLPNVLSPVMVQLSLMMAFALLAEASLSFLGLGVLPPDASWGVMLGRAFSDIRLAPYLIYWPGLAIAITTLAFNILGDGISDALGREQRTERKGTLR